MPDNTLQVTLDPLRTFAAANALERGHYRRMPDWGRSNE